MKSITCHLARLRPGLTLPDLPLALGQRTAAEFLRAGSTGGDGAPGVSLRMDTSSLDQVQVPPQVPTDYFRLHLALRLAVPNPPVPGAVDHIGLLFADRFADRPSLLGLMFDLGFQPNELPPIEPAYHVVPREGCAVFLDAVRALRGEGPAYASEAVFTAIHELGHVFNLWHVPSPVTFMTQSEPAAPYGPESFWFIAPQREYLRRCDSSPYVCPGGSPWGVRGTSGPSGDNPFSAPEQRDGLELSLDVSPREAWRFEPMELDVTLKLEPGQPGPIEVPDSLDPGYDAFDVWIEQPDGERRRYRSPVLYCANPARLTIGADAPFERDITLFGQGGSYTFGSPGVHRIAATLRLAGGSVLRSNTTELLIKAPQPRSARYRRLSKTLSLPGNAKLLFTRAPAAGARIDQLTDLCRGRDRSWLSASVGYAVAQALLKRGGGRTRRAIDSRRFAERLLKRALDSDVLGRHRQKRAERLLGSVLDG